MSEVTFMSTGEREYRLNHEQAVKIVIEYLRNPSSPSSSNYGYDVHVHKLLYEHCQKAYGIMHNETGRIIKVISPLFIDACWELCRRGILRPYTRDTEGQGTSQGAGFSITGYGQQWLKETDFDDYVPTEPDQFGNMLKPFSLVFGQGFHERAQEAVRCYNAHAFLACCAMAGAAGETVINKIAGKLAIIHHEYEPVTKTREKIINNLSKPRTKECLMSFSEIVKYFRDEGLHHESWEKMPEKAFLSLTMLLRFAHFAKGEWFQDEGRKYN